MRDQRTKQEQAAAAGQSSQRIGGDKVSEQLLMASRALGNDSLQKRIEAGNTSRDDLMAHIHLRLDSVKAVQLEEAHLTSARAQRNWWHEVAGDRDIAKPDPTRWGKVGAAYERVVRALMRGDLGQGKQLMRQATAIEQQTVDQTTSLIDTELVVANQTLPESFDAIVAGQTCGACDDNGLLDKTQDIQQEGRTIEDPPVRATVAKPWWAEEEEEEEENDDADGAG